MKKALLFTFAFISALSLQADILYTNYGDGWRIGLNENVVVDADMNGQNDFYINGYTNELGFVPIFAQGCFSSPNFSAINNLGSRELTIHSAGDILDNNLNTMSFIDDDRGSAAALTSSSTDLATGWVDGEDRYVGFYIFATGRFGWIKVELDVNAQELIIKEMAVEMISHAPLEVGYTGQVVVIEEPTLTTVNNARSGEVVTIETTSTQELEKDLQNVMIAPNPATERVNLFFEYQGTENLNIVIVNSVGKEVYRTTNGLATGEVNLDIPITDWNSGIYFIQFQTKKGVKTERLSVVK